MKIKHLPIALAALILASCGGSNNGGESTTATNPNDSLAEYVAYQVYKLICPDSTAPLRNPIENSLEYQVFSMPNDETERSETVLCFPKKNGGYLAVYNVEECSVVGDGGCYNLAFKAYDYSDGRVKEDNSLLPKPSFDDFNKYEALWFYNPKDKNLVSAKDAFAKDDFKYDLWRDNTISVSVVSVGEGDLFLYMFYKFNGERFEQVESKNEWLGIISTKGLGKLCVGDVPPSQLAGFDINTMGRTMYFNRNAKKEFKLALSADGKIDTIIVVGKSYDYRYWCGGGYCYLGVGSDFDSELAKMVDDFVYEDDHFCIKTDGYVVEFCCKPEYHKIESIKIYKQAEANTSDYDENNSNSDLPPTATGDLNGDGIKDSVAFNKGFFVYFGSKDGKYNLFKTYKVLDLESNDYITFKTSAKIDDGKLIISTRKNGDGWDNLDYTLKFQDGDFVLLKLYEDGGLDGSSEITYDFEAKTYKGDFDECEGDSYTTTAKLKNLPSPKLSDIVIGDSPYDCIDGYIDESTVKTKTR